MARLQHKNKRATHCPAKWMEPKPKKPHQYKILDQAIHGE
jgi:hypothetical protein